MFIQLPRKMHVNFRFRSSRYNPKIGTLYCRITVDGVRAPEKSTYIKIEKAQWDNRAQCVKRNAPNSTTLNARLNKIRAAVDQAFICLGEYVTAMKLVEMVFGPKDKPLKTKLSEIFKMYVELKRSTTDNTEATFKKYEQYLKNILRCFGDPYVMDISEQSYLRFCGWLKAQYSSRAYIAKNAQFLRTLLEMAASRGYLLGNPSKLISFSRDDNYDTTHLTFQQVRMLYEYDFSIHPMKPSALRVIEEERDAFVFCCFTGMHHVDYTTKSYEIVWMGERPWLRGYRVKSVEGKKDKLYEMPLHPFAQAIIAKYGGIEKLPVRNNGERNARLKMIAAYCGLPMSLSTKIARKTMANYCLNTLRMRAETVAAVLGLRSTKYLKHYARITQESIDHEMTFPKPGSAKVVPILPYNSNILAKM